MKISDICTSPAQACRPDMDLAAAARLMKTLGIGAMPVVDGQRHVIAMITDRDICLAAGTRDLRPSELRVGEVMSPGIHSCRPQDDVEVALRVMSTYHVRRLPVADDQDAVLGVLSIDDIARTADASIEPLLLRTFAEICRHESRPAVPEPPLNTPTSTEAA